MVKKIYLIILNELILLKKFLHIFVFHIIHIIFN